MSVVEILHMIYAYVPQEVIIIILGGLTMGVILEIEERKNRKINGKKSKK